MRRRLTWRRRLAIGTGLIVVGLILLRGLWGFAANQRLARQIEQYRAAGQLVYAAEFNAQLDAVEESRNAAVLLEKAMDKYVPTTASGIDASTFFYEPSSFEKNASDARELMESNAEVLALVRQARQLPDVAWTKKLGQPTAGVLSAHRQLSFARFLWFVAAHSFRTGDHASAVATLRDLLAFTEAVGAHPAMISPMLAQAYLDMEFRLIEEYGSILRVAGRAHESEETLTPAAREQVEELVRELVSERLARKNEVQAYLGSRSLLLDTLETCGLLDAVAPQSLGSLLGIKPFKHIVDFTFHPVLVLDIGREVHCDTLASEAVAEPTWREADRRFHDEPVSAHLMYRLTHPITFTPFGTSSASVQLSVRSFFEFLARRRMAAVALAIRLYEVDHKRRPVELAALVPHYLHTVPQDPFSADGAKLGYLPAAEPALLYSVGFDGRDHKGQEILKPDGSRNMEESDIRFYLDGKPES